MDDFGDTTKIEVIVKAEERDEAVNMLRMFSSLPQEMQRDALAFIRGAQFQQLLARQRAPSPPPGA